MSNIASFTGRFRAQKNIHHSQASKIARRPRESAVCNQCRISKLRCDRVRPVCGSCVKRGEAHACMYDRLVGGKADSAKQHIADDRLAHLESLVKQLMQTAKTTEPQTAFPGKPTDLERSPSVQPSDPVSIGADQADYVGSTHWSAVLDEIDILKAELAGALDLEDGVDSSFEQTNRTGQESIFGSPHSYSLQQILHDFLPSKLETDRLLAVYFQGENFIHPFIHIHHFQQQYQTFWSNTSNVNLLWLSLLFSIFDMASLITARIVSTGPAGEKPDAARSAFHVAAGQCLVLGKYHEPQEFVVEALLSYAHCKSLTSLDPLRETGAILSMAVRSAYQLGYHRDPDLFKGFTVFEGEMRRRTWAVCKHLDLMTSFQLGLPSSICLENCDSKSLRNLSDADFGPDSKELPPSRGDDHATRLLWFVVKERQIETFAEVCRNALSHKEKSQAEIRELDRKVRQMHDAIPESLRIRPFSECMSEEPFIIVTKIYLEFIHLKSLCILHRRYMARGDPYSTVSCLDAGKKIVRQFLEMYQEFAPGGQLYMARWMLGCYTMNDFLLATTVLCLSVYSQLKQNAIIDKSNDNEVFDLLEQAYHFCVDKSHVSRDARRVSQIVRLTLNKPKSVNDLTKNCKPSHSDAEAVAQMKLASVEQFPVTFSGEDNMDWNLDPLDFFQPFSSVSDRIGDIDWTVFDPVPWTRDT